MDSIKCKEDEIDEDPQQQMHRYSTRSNVNAQQVQQQFLMQEAQ